MNSHDPQPETFPCPNCGEEVPAGAPCCPECGADENTGWSQDTMYDDLDLPDSNEGSEGHDLDSQLESAPYGRKLPIAVVSIIVVLLVIAFLKCVL